MRDYLLLALDPGVTTGWALVRKRNKEILGCGDLDADDVGPCIDRVVRYAYRCGNKIEVVVEEMPTPQGGDLAVELEYVRRTIHHWVVEVFEVPTEYVPPGTWKNSRAARVMVAPESWHGRSLSAHQRDALTMAHYVISRPKERK
jgi:hypothetical protein